MLAVKPRFDFDRDAFAFPNELIWEYDFDPATGAASSRRREPRPSYAHRCFALVRAVRQFHYHARFEPTAARGDDATYAALVRSVLARDPRRPCAPDRTIAIPGYAGLRELSRDREPLLKAACGGAWRSYALRSHWHVVVPVTRRHQARTARELLDAAAGDRAPIVHLLRFPSLAINHGMVVFDGAPTESGAAFLAYDPNDPARPARLTYDRATRTFSLAPNRYFRGGTLTVIEIFRRFLL